MLESCRAAADLQHLIRYYYQFEATLAAAVTVQPVPARSPQILEFMFGTYYQVHRLGSNLTETAAPVALVGAKTRRVVDLQMQGKVDAFTIVFQPGAMAALFGMPVDQLTDQDYSAQDVVGHQIGELHLRLAEVSTLPDRAQVADRFLRRLQNSQSPTAIAKAAAAMNHSNGRLRVAELAHRSGLGVRQFERRFVSEIGVTPKLYSRILRFESALRLKSQGPKRTWTDIAHGLGYHDQMHMVHDFGHFAGASPNSICHQLDMFVKPEALSGDPTE
jgi:AraC-like DNA-binding protein